MLGFDIGMLFAIDGTNRWHLEQCRTATHTYVKYCKVSHNNVRILWKKALAPFIIKRVVNGYCIILSYYVYIGIIVLTI